MSAAPKKVIPAMLTDTDQLLTMVKNLSDPASAAHAGEEMEAFSNKGFCLLQPLIKPVCEQALREACVQLAELDSNKNTAQSAAVFPQQFLPCAIRQLLWELSSSTLMRHFASLTQSPPLLPDPFLVEGGLQPWRDLVQQGGKVNADAVCKLRHPITDLQKKVRLELFVADPPHSGGNANGNDSVEIIVQKAGISTALTIRSGDAVLMACDDTVLHYPADRLEGWCSYVFYYYVNDRARNLNGEEQPSAVY